VVRVGRLAVALLASALLAPCSVEAQQANKPRIGILRAGMAHAQSGPESPKGPFMQGLKDLGWVEGQNFELVHRPADGKLDRLPALAQELVRMNVDVIVTFGSTIRPAAEATRTIPIVMIAGSSDPVADGLVKSLAHPGTNVTGVTWSTGTQLIGKNLQLLKEILPRLSRVAVLHDGVADKAFGRAWEDAAGPLGVTVQRYTDPDALEPTIVTITQSGAEAMYVVLTGVNISHRDRVAAVALAHRLPTFAILRELPEAGGLMSYGPNLAQLHRRGAAYVDKILKGAKPGDLPIEQPTQFELAVNLKTARALNLTIPRSLLLQADYVLE